MWILVCAVGGAGCSLFADEQDPVDLAQPWSAAVPAEVGMDPEGLAEAVARAGALPRFRSLLVVRNGRLVTEAYFHGNHRDSLNDARSVTKSVVSLLVGVALAEGFIESLDETLGEHLHPHVQALEPAHQAISIRDLLTMTGGFRWDELEGTAYADWIQSADHITYLLEQGLSDEPGSRFVYNSAAVHLLGVVLQEAVGMPLPAFADRHLFGRIGVRRSEWEPLTRGYVNGGAGLDLRPRDLARIGQLLLQEGASGSSSVVPADWVTQATTPRFGWRSMFGPLQAFTYGYLWWVEDRDPASAAFAWGYGGQYIYVVPVHELVVVTTTDWRGLSQDGGADALEEAALGVIIEYVLPAVQGTVEAGKQQ